MTQPTASDPVLVVLGDIQISRHWIVTPIGTVRTSGAEISAAGQTTVTQRIPVWAIVLAIVLFPLGLLFLLIKEDAFLPGMLVTIRAGGFAYAAMVPVPTPAAHADASARVEYARRLLVAAPV